MNDMQRVFVVVKINTKYPKRWSVREEIRRITGVSIPWKEGDSYRFDIKKGDVRKLVDAGLNVEVVE